MARRIALTRVELKRQRETLARYERFLPALERRQQQLRAAVQATERELDRARARLDEAAASFRAYAAVLADPAGLDLERLTEPVETTIDHDNVAGVRVPLFRDVVFAPADYGLIATPPWVDRAVADLRELRRLSLLVAALEERRTLLRHELVRVIQRMNLFEKVKIPEAREAIRRIRVHLGDEMAAAVGRAKIAKTRLAGGQDAPPGEAGP